MTNEFLSLAGLTCEVTIDGNDARLIAEAVALFLSDSARKKASYEDTKLPEWRYLTALRIADEQQIEAMAKRVRTAIAASGGGTDL